MCGPEWDKDNDTISTATETNPTNTFAGGGFYAFDTLAWDRNRSIASGQQPGGGVLLDGMNLRDQGPGGLGYVHYNGCDPIDSDDWGTGHLLRMIEGSGRKWSDYPRMQVGDLSLRQGGTFYDCAGGDPHVTHKNGLDVDVRYLRFSGEAALNICTQFNSYDIEATVRLINAIVVSNADGQDGRPRISVVLVDTGCVEIGKLPYRVDN